MQLVNLDSLVDEVIEVCLVTEVWMAYLAVTVVLAQGAYQVTEVVQEYKAIRAEMVDQAKMADLEFVDSLDFLVKEDLRVSKEPLDKMAFQVVEA